MPRPQNSHFRIPNIINKMPDVIDHIFWGKLQILFIFFPNNEPILKNNIWKKLIINGKIKLLIPMILLPIPIQIESIDSAKPRNNASLLSILFDLSKSEFTGSFIIFIVIPRNLIKKEYVFFLVTLLHFEFLLLFILLLVLSFFKAWKQTKIPINIKIKFPKYFVIKFGSINYIILPK